MPRPTAFQGQLSPIAYAIAAPALMLSQHLVVFAAYRWATTKLDLDIEFWLLPLRRLADLPGLTNWVAALAFAFALTIAGGLAVLSFRRASWSNWGHALAALAVIPAVQLVAVALLIILPRIKRGEASRSEAGIKIAHVIQGVVAGVAIIVVALLISALTLGTYGWGLFVMTPLLVGTTTAYLANRQVPLEPGRTTPLVLLAAVLGSMSLIMLALEGLICILLASPLCALAALMGGQMGREAALARHRRNNPLLSVATLPLLFALEAAMPPVMPIDTVEQIVIAAPTESVWRALTSDKPIAASAGLVGHAGLAYPLQGRLLGAGPGAERLGVFSTGIAHERVTEWQPAHKLTFVVLSQPPAMEEMSPYRRVHAPHVAGYFDTAGTSFNLDALPGGKTRLTARAAHVLRIDPVLYWEPVARWAIGANVRRVLEDIRVKAEQR